jgi:hypothetical protein
MRRGLRRLAVVLGAALLGIGLAMGATVIAVERGCTAAPAPGAKAAPGFDIRDPGYRRAEGDSYLTYPEWNIVHAYADLAGVTRRASESAFDYLAAVRGFWSSLCGATRTASRIGPVTSAQKVTNYVIGFSFTAEMAVQGLYERTVGALTARWRGDERTAEDAFALRMRDDYAAFLRQTPWYRFPFGETLARFWRETPFRPSLRSVERRVALTLECGVKWAYAALIRYAAGFSPADLTIRSVVAGLDDADLLAEPRIKRIREVAAPDGRVATLVETPRYRALTEIVRFLGERKRSFLEIAGNRHILTTVVAPADKPMDTPGAVEIFSLPIQSEPGWRRVGLDTEVPALAAQVGLVEAQGARFEHAYDY